MRSLAEAAFCPSTLLSHPSAILIREAPCLWTNGSKAVGIGPPAPSLGSPI